MNMLARLLLIASIPCFALGFLGFAIFLHPLSTIVLVLCVFRRLVRKGRVYFWAHGTAKWADSDDLYYAGMTYKE